MMINHPDPQVTYIIAKFLTKGKQASSNPVHGYTRYSTPPTSTHLGQTAEWCINVPDQTTLKSCIALLRNSQADEKTHRSGGISILASSGAFKATKYIRVCRRHSNFLWLPANTFYFDFPIKLLYC